MENQVTKHEGGRPLALVTEQRVKATIQLYVRGQASATAIARHLDVSITTATNLRKKALKQIQLAKGGEDEIYKDKMISILRVEDVIAQGWLLYEEANNVKEKNRILNTILSSLKLFAELNGHIGNQSPTNNYISIEQKLIMNILDLTEKDFSEKNFHKTIMKLADFYQRTNGGQGITRQNQELVEAKHINTPKGKTTPCLGQFSTV